MTPLDPKTRPLLDLIAALGEPPLSQQTPAEFRARRERGREIVNLPWTETPVVRDIEVAGAAGRLKARLYDSVDGGKRPTLIYFHGGGFVYGSLESHHPLCCRLALAGGFRVIAVDYRLAPETPFPGPHLDAIAAVKSIIAEASHHGVDADRVALGGDSAGACLATVAARKLKREGGPEIAFQLLIYPVVQSGEETWSRKTFADGYFLTREAMNWFDGHYLPAGVDREDEAVSPLRTPPPKGLAPAYVITAGYDPLFDEGRAYAESLKASGIAATHVDYPDQVHGFVSLSAFSTVAIEAIEQAARAVSDALG
ncbi:MAG: alpha/beta hydrolase [Parvularculaceae bacterium]